MRWLLILLLFTAGCTTPLNCLGGWIPSKQYALEHHKTVDKVKEYYFAPEAQEVIKDIPCVRGVTIGGSYVVGANFWGTLAGVLTGSGYSPKCIMNERAMEHYGVEAIIHEYVHHSENLIDHKAFAEAYKKMGKDRLWAGLVLYAEPRADRWVTNVFGISEYSEYIAYVAARMAKQRSGPDYMWKVLEKVLKKP